MGTTELVTLQLRMFLIMLVGLFFRKKGLISNEGKKNLTDLVIYLILPCNIVKSFMITFDNSVLKNFGLVLLISVCIQLLCTFLAKILYNQMDADKKKVLQYGTVVSNAGFLGNPVAEGVFGSIGLAMASIYLIPQRIVMWSAGVSYFTESASKKQICKRVLTHPCIVAVAIGLAFMFLQISLPAFLDSALKDFSNCNTAMSMLVIGTILADVKPRDLFEKTIFVYSGLRLVIIPLLVYLCCQFFQIDPLATGVSVLLAAMPAASTTAILASKYNGNAVYASKCVVTSTILSLISTPIWSMILLSPLS